MVDNILRVAFKHERRIESRPLYQYDYGQVLKFIDLELPYSYEVHFSNHERGSSITQLGNENGVAIPDSLLTSGLPVYAWLYLHAGNADGETEYMVKIPVYKRAAITNDQPTPVQQDVITQTIAALASGVAVATASASSAMDAATEATRACGAARAYMETTQEYRDAAIAATSHYPKIEDDYWYVWDIITEQFINTDISARGSKGDPFTYDDFTPEQLANLTGPSGIDGITFIPSVSSEGIISWTNDGGKQNPEPMNIKGPIGLAGPTGDDGFSPLVSIVKEDNVATITITDRNGTTSASIIDGIDGAPGIDGLTFIPSVSSDGVISWTNDGGATNPSSVNIKGPQGEQGEQGVQGETGATFTPSVSSDGIISWTNDKGKENPLSVNIRGPQGIQGVQGETGATGSRGDTGTTFTPAVSSEGIISWTNDDNKENPEPRNIRGPQGEQGIQGETGPSGFSPVIAVSSIAGGHQVSITDASGTQSFNVMDGTGSVQSVNNKTGVVVLTAEDVGALPSDTVIPSVPDASDATPAALGMASAGISSAYARADHVHANPIPAVTSADDGKIMQVVNGTWAAVSLQSASGVSF